MIPIWCKGILNPKPSFCGCLWAQYNQALGKLNLINQMLKYTTLNDFERVEFTEDHNSEKGLNFLFFINLNFSTLERVIFFSLNENYNP